MEIRRALVFALVIIVTSMSSQALGDVFRWGWEPPNWNTGEVIPGTAGIEPGPNLDFSGLQLDHALLRQIDLTSVDFTRANLNGAMFWESNLTNADLTDASIAGANFNRVMGFTKEQLYSTTSYREKDLWAGIRHVDPDGWVEDFSFVATHLDMSTWDFSDQDLTLAVLSEANLFGANLSGTNLSGTDLRRSTLKLAELRGAQIIGAQFARARDFTEEQLYSTASYQSNDLWGGGFNRYEGSMHGIGLQHLDMSNWNFDGQNLSQAGFDFSNLSNVDFTSANLTGANFVGADLMNADLTDAVITGARFDRAISITKEQLYATENYKSKDLWAGGVERNSNFGLSLRELDLSTWDFGGQNLTSADLSGADLSGANLAGANLRLADLSNAILDSTVFDSETTYNQRTRFPAGFDPVAAGLTFYAEQAGDFDANGVLDITDLRLLSHVSWWDLTHDLNGDGGVDVADRRFWITDLKQTWFGDSNLDGEFNSSDLVAVFKAGEYEDGIPRNSGWSAGDWDGDREFTSSDLVMAFVDGGFERGPRAAVRTVPEPCSHCVLFAGLVGLSIVCGRGRGGCIARSTEHQRRSNTRAQFIIGLVTSIVSCGQFAQLTHAQIFRWDTGEVIPGTEERELTEGADFSNLDLAFADLQHVTHSHLDFSGANLSSASLTDAIMSSTDFSGADLSDANLSGASFLHSEMKAATFAGANLTRTDLTVANLTDADLSDAIITWASFNNAFSDRTGLTQEQLYSTASYQAKNLMGIVLATEHKQAFQSIDLSAQDLRGAVLSVDFRPLDLTGANLRGANLAHAVLNHATLAEANLSGANLSNTNLNGADLSSTRFDSNTTYTEWTQWPEGFDPAQAGLTLLSPEPGDFDANGILDATDLEFLQEAPTNFNHRFDLMNRIHFFEYGVNSLFDLNEDGLVDLDDHQVWVKDLKQVYYGDANLDGEFNSADMVQVFASGQYEDDARVNSTWVTGDWDGDWEFTSADLVVAFQDGGYEIGPRLVTSVAVPESTSQILLLGAGLALAIVVRRRNGCEFKALHAMVDTALVLAIGAAATTHTQAEVVHHWGFEQGTDFLDDSVGNVTLTTVPNDGQGAPITEVSLPNDDRGEFFPSSFNNLGRNSSAVEFHRATNRGLLGLESTPMDGDFTIELFTHVDRLSRVGMAANLAGQLSKATTVGGHSWSFKIRMDGWRDTLPHELAFANSDGTNWFAPRSGIFIDERTDYYLAGAFDLVGRKVHYYAYNLEEDSLEITTVPHSMNRLNPDSTMVIGDAECSCAVDGLVDEVRLSRGVVPFEELLMHDAEFTPSRSGVPSTVSVGPDAYFQVDGTRAIDLRLRPSATLNDSRRHVAKFVLPGFRNEDAVLQEAVLRVFVTETGNSDAAELSIFHGQADNQPEMVLGDFDDVRYVDTTIDVYASDGVPQAYRDIDVTDLVRTDYRMDGDSPVTSLRFQSSVDSRFAIATPGNSAQRPQLILSFRSLIAGDFDGNGILDASDLDLLAEAIQQQDSAYDLNADGMIDQADRLTWVKELKTTWLGDANLDGQFNSGDLVQVFRTGHYGDAIQMNSGWAEGDWNGDGEFDSGDLVTAFQDGGFEQGRRDAVASVPEPAYSTSMLSLIVLVCSRRIISSTHQ